MSEERRGEDKDKVNYKKRSKPEYLERVIGKLSSLDEIQKEYLTSRWMYFTFWKKHLANKNRNYYYGWRLFTIIGGMMVPALVNLKDSSTIEILECHGTLIISILSLLVAISASVEQFFHYGDRRQLFRRTEHTLLSEGWLFFGMSEKYKGFLNHKAAFPKFVAEIEHIIQQHMEDYLPKASGAPDEIPSRDETLDKIKEIIDFVKTSDGKVDVEKLKILREGPVIREYWEDQFKDTNIKLFEEALNKNKSVVNLLYENLKNQSRK